jgi:NAD-dependent SIR2 family protein deacetylase
MTWDSAAFANLRQFITQHRRLLVITGAGCSVESGIPTYRNHSGQWLRNQPIQHTDFINQASARKRYWARSLAGWPAVHMARPNDAHRALAAMEARQQIPLLVTQNVDRLHQKAGQKHVIDLHGRLDQVICLDCHQVSEREVMQQRLLLLNALTPPEALALAPDGDADVDEQLIRDLLVPDCERCNGILKPNVVFFGGAVSKLIVEAITSQLDQVDGLLIVGSSLSVFSGFRFCRLAHRNSVPIAAINQGKTRADDLFSVKLEADCSAALAELERVSGC